MTLKTLGKSTSEIEVSNIDIHGFWLYVKGMEYFLPFDEYPWFKNAKVGDIIDVELLHESHLHWPKLDVDLELLSLETPNQTPLLYK